MANPQHEPTMEEILASIRKIIAEDPPGGESASASPAESDEPEVLDLTQEVQEESTVTASAAAEEQATTDANDTATHSSEGIFSDKARKALSDAFAGLEPESHQTGNEQVPSMSGLPLEALFEKAVREAFEPVLQKWLDDNASVLIDRTKPAISEWLDRHFPAMLEDAVRNEVARAVMARRR